MKPESWKPGKKLMMKRTEGAAKQASIVRVRTRPKKGDRIVEVNLPGPTGGWTVVKIDNVREHI